MDILIINWILESIVTWEDERVGFVLWFYGWVTHSNNPGLPVDLPSEVDHRLEGVVVGNLVPGHPGHLVISGVHGPHDPFCIQPHPLHSPLSVVIVGIYSRIVSLNESFWFHWLSCSINTIYTQKIGSLNYDSKYQKSNLDHLFQLVQVQPQKPFQHLSGEMCRHFSVKISKMLCYYGQFLS